MNPSKAQHFSVPALEDLFDELLAMSHYGIILTQQTKTLIPAAELIGFGGINSLPFSFFHIFQPPSDPARTSSPSMDGPDNIKRKESRESECRETAKNTSFNCSIPLGQTTFWLLLLFCSLYRQYAHK